MGKTKKKEATNNKVQASKCSCEDPYKCSCGNRPERPSKGHKWYPEDQIWAGKGHKQKGASGQVATFSQQATVTAKGKTQVQQWQRLPSQLLAELCQKQKRKPPKYHSIQEGSSFKYRVIVCDTKDSEKDLIFIPAQAVANEEQAKEEAAMLGLLELTPTIPHERKLPEPYRTTWLNAIAAQKSKEASDHGKGLELKQSKKDSTVASTSQPTTQTNAAQASSTLTLGTKYTSNASKRHQFEEKRRMRNEKIRRHDAIRMANQNHPVFMSASIRKQIESLLRSETNSTDNRNENEEDDNDDMEDAAHDAQAYVEERLHHEGFSKRQARMASSATLKSNPNLDIDEERVWDTLYEQCLQWLLVHVDEEQLPEGFDPRGRTLDVVVAPTQSSTNKPSGSAEASNEGETIALAENYGISVKEAGLMVAKAREERKENEQVFWETIIAVSGLSIFGERSEVASDEMYESTKEELEALEAIFASDFQSEAKDHDFTSIKIALAQDSMVLALDVKNGVYPAIPPARILVKGKWPEKCGVALHVDLLKFVADLPLGEPMIFSIHAHVQDLIQSCNFDNPFSLLPLLGVQPENSKTVEAVASLNATYEEIEISVSNLVQTPQRRPRELRKTFWTIHPRDTPAALAFPAVGSPIKRMRESLPAAKARQEFLAALKRAEKNGRVVLVTGETGSGKSTQLPAYILENYPEGSKIVVAQPRRLAATGVASRVAEERGEVEPGTDSVGYVVRGDSAVCYKCRLLFCTTGVLLRQLQSESALECITHIVIDEVHERNLDSDILMGLLKQLLPSYPNIQVILMSATLDAERFTNYWGSATPHVHIPGRTFPVADFSLEDVLKLTGFIPPKNKKKGTDKDAQSKQKNDFASDSQGEAIQFDESVAHNEHNSAELGMRGEDLLKRVDESSPDVDLIASLVRYIIVNNIHTSGGSILIFMAGVPEINNVLEAIKLNTNDLLVRLLPLHGGLQPKEQSEIFKPAPKRFTKVICSTNVAETSVTIPDCTVVIDSCREKQSSYDPTNRMPLLLEKFASKASIKQRRGRAGRVREGICYRLISTSTYASLDEHTEPEILRVALDQTLLQLLFLGVENGSGSFIRSLLDPPSPASVDAAKYSLQKLGAIKRMHEDELILSSLGAHLAGIPAPPTVGKMLIMGSILGCRDAALAMAAGMSVGRSPFIRFDKPRGKNSIDEMKSENILKARAEIFDTVGNSDHALFALLFSKWHSVGPGVHKKLCESLGLSFNSMREMSQLYKQLDSSLTQAGFAATSESNRNAQSWRIIHACAVSAMSPGQLVKVRRPAAKYLDTAEGSKVKDGEARELQFFIRTKLQSSTETTQEERVFIHPSSKNFATGNYSCPFLVFHSMVRTSKPFLRDVTECSAYPLLLFGGDLEILASKETVVIDGWVELSANARIGSLMGGLRRRVDVLLAEKVKNPLLEIEASSEMKLIVKLIRTDGLGS